MTTSQAPIPVDRRHLVAVAVGGALGAATRYGIGRAVPTSQFPWATLGINVTGSFALGLIIRWVANRPMVRSLVAVGFLGGYTTFSTFAVDAVVLIKDGHVATAVVYVVASLAGGIVAAAAGMRVAR